MSSKTISRLTHSVARFESGDHTLSVESGVALSAASRPRAIAFAFEVFSDTDSGADVRLTVDSREFGAILDGMLVADPALAMKLMADRVATVATTQFIDGLKAAATNSATLSRSVIV